MSGCFLLASAIVQYQRKIRLLLFFIIILRYCFSNLVRYFRSSAGYQERKGYISAGKLAKHT